jgi:hypothetical protein
VTIELYFILSTLRYSNSLELCVAAMYSSNKSKGKAVLVRAYYRTTGLQEFGARRLLGNRHMKVVKLSAVHTGRLYPQGNIPGTHFCQRLSRSQGHNAVGRIVSINPLNTKRRPLYLKTQFVPRSKHFSSRLQKPTSLCCKWNKSLFVLR